MNKDKLAIVERLRGSAAGFAKWPQDRSTADNLTNAAAMIEALYEALVIMVAEKRDYMKRNNLGNPDKQDTIRTAETALALARGGQP